MCLPAKQDYLDVVKFLASRGAEVNMKSDAMVL